MPSKGSTLKVGERYNPLNKKFYNKFKKDTGSTIDYPTFIKIITTTNELMREAISEEEVGIQLPENLGHIIVTKYKSKKIPIDWINSNRLGKIVPLLNLHSFGYIHHIKWFTFGVNFVNNRIYKFEPYRILKRRVAKNVKGGKKYFKWENSNLWSTTKMERSLNKLYKKEE